jgi:16S rRNA (cytidine1402-2'-O)-methyltransferase
MLPLHDHNESDMTPRLLERLRGGARLALASDAGTPLVSDPGYRLVRAAIEAGVPVTAVPGPNAAVVALTLSGLPPQPFLFLGFLPPAAVPRAPEIARLRAAERARLSAPRGAARGAAPPRRALGALAEGLAGRAGGGGAGADQAFRGGPTGSLAELAGHYAPARARGEICIVIVPATRGG